MSRTEQAELDTVHVWSDWVDGRAEHGALLEWLDDDERARAGRFRFERDRIRFVARRLLLRQVLSGYLGLAPAMVCYRTSPMGRPELQPAAGVTFSVSHSDGLAIVAVARGRLVGVDVERVRPIADGLDLARGFFAPREYEHLRTTTEAGRSRAFLELWTRKESYVKAIGAGMSMPFDEFDVLDRDDRRPEPLGETTAGMPFAFASLDGLPGYVGSVAVSGSSVTLNHMTPMAVAS
jgi:4'-phosphopantetheinyl transferase